MISDVSPSHKATIPVTIIVTGYNQSDLIDPAITSALAQDYPNLQVILTDDCSSDDTFDRMHQAAARYDGPHHVIANRLATNRGTYGNIYDAFLQATGQLIVFAGGDDISYPNRVSRLVEHWQATSADLIYSGYDVIDEIGRTVKAGVKPFADTLYLLDYFPTRKVEPVVGATMACARSVLERFPVPARRVRAEDVYLNLFVTLHGGRVELLPEALVGYRRHAGAITHDVGPDPSRASVATHERALMGWAGAIAAVLELFLAELDRHGADPAVRRIVQDDVTVFRLRSRFHEAGLAEKLRALPIFARRQTQLAWMLPRLAGLPVFSLAKSYLLAARHRRSQGSPR